MADAQTSNYTDEDEWARDARSLRRQFLRCLGHAIICELINMSNVVCMHGRCYRALLLRIYRTPVVDEYLLLT